MIITDEMVDKAAEAYWRSPKGDSRSYMRAALEAVAPMLIAQGMRASPPMENELHYLRSILRCLREVKSFANSRNMEPTLRNEALADNIDWLDCYIDQRTGA